MTQTISNPNTGIHRDIPDSVYHGLSGSYSSSQLKDILEDPEIFFKKYISKEIVKPHLPAFDVGTYFHTAILEPDLLEEKCAVYGGAVRKGKAWDDFKEANEGKAIITKSDLDSVGRLIEAVKDSPIAMDLINDSEYEVSAFCTVYVFDGEVYGESPLGNLLLLTVKEGWKSVEDEGTEEAVKEFGVKLLLKVRADAICTKRGIISDLKSTTGNAKSESDMGRAVSNFKYDLSASLYLDIFTLATGIEHHTFSWIFASKDTGTCRTFNMGEKYKLIGRAKWRRAAILLAKYIEADWQFSDELGTIDPPEWETSWLNK